MEKTTKEPDVLELIEAGRTRLQQRRETGDMSAKDAQRRDDYLKKIAGQYAEVSRLSEPRVFLSYAVNGRDLYAEAYKRIHDTQSTEYGRKFRVEVGFREEGQPEVIDHVRGQMQKCCLFVGLLTADFPLIKNDAEAMFAPSGWVILEAGMALSLGIPCVLMVEKGVHQDFWKKQLGQWRHVEFETDRFKPALDRVSRLLKEHYDYLRKAA